MGCLDADTGSWCRQFGWIGAWGGGSEGLSERQFERGRGRTGAYRESSMSKRVEPILCLHSLSSFVIILYNSCLNSGLEDL